MNGFTGMDIETVRRLAQNMQQLSQNVSTVATTVDGLLSQLASLWQGEDAHRVGGEWSGNYRPALLRAGAEIADLATSLERNATDQAVATAASGSVASIGAGLVGTGAAFGVVSGGTALAAYVSRMKQGRAAWTSGLTVDRTERIGLRTRVSRDESGRIGSIPISGGYSATASASAAATQRLSLSRNGVDASLTASAAVGVAASAYGTVGNRTIGAEGRATVRAGAAADGKLSAHMGPDGVHAAAKIGAYAGVQATASASGHVSGVGGTAAVTGYAGIGGHAQVEAHITANEVKATVDIAGAIGIGGGVRFTVDVQPEQVLSDVAKFAPLWSL